jgi:hypothetical protein
VSSGCLRYNTYSDGKEAHCNSKMFKAAKNTDYSPYRNANKVN